MFMQSRRGVEGNAVIWVTVLQLWHFESQQALRVFNHKVVKVCTKVDAADMVSA